MHLCLWLPHVCRQERLELLASTLCWLLHCGGQLVGAGFVCRSRLPHHVGSSEYCSTCKTQVLHLVKIFIRYMQLIVLRPREWLSMFTSVPWCTMAVELADAQRPNFPRVSDSGSISLFIPPSLLDAVTNGPAGQREAGLSGEEGWQRGCWLWPAFLTLSVCWCVCPFWGWGLSWRQVFVSHFKSVTFHKQDSKQEF